MAANTSIVRDALRRHVLRALSNGEEVTINSARAAVEEELELETGFFRNEPDWKSKSKAIITSAVEEHEDNGSDLNTGSKRPSPSQDSRPTKKTKRAIAQESGSEDVQDDAVEDGTRADSMKKSSSTKSKQKEKKSQPSKTSSKVDSKANARTKRRAPPNIVNSDSGTEADDHARATSTADQENVAPEDDESDMSIVLDEPPKKKRQKKEQAERSNKAPTKSKASSAKTLSPDEEQIKTLQSHLKQCGINRVWGRELAAYDDSKDKIRHLKTMLQDAGMTGRFSAEKAKQIKEARELKAELESAKEFDKNFGAESTTGRSRRARSSKTTTIVDDDSDEQEPQVNKPLSTGLVDFGDSGDDGSD